MQSGDLCCCALPLLWRFCSQAAALSALLLASRPPLELILNPPQPKESIKVKLQKAKVATSRSFVKASLWAQRLVASAVPAGPVHAGSEGEGWAGHQGPARALWQCYHLTIYNISRIDLMSRHSVGLTFPGYGPASIQVLTKLRHGKKE